MKVNTIIKFALLFITLLLTNFLLLAQTYNMSNISVTDASGTLYDSGGAGSNYGNNQNFTFTICSAVSTCFELNFSQFNLENNADFLRIYSGPTTASLLIGQYTGTALPGTLNINSSCITFNFISNGSVTAAGFTITWQSQTSNPDLWNCVGELSSIICSGTGTEGLFDPNPALNSPFYTTGGPNVLSTADCLASPTEIMPVYGGFELDDLSCVGPLIETQTEITTSPNFASPGTQSISVSFSGIPDEAIIEDIEISIAYEGTMPTSQGDINSLSVTAPGGISIMSWSDSACGPNVGPGGDPDAIGAGTGGDNFGLNNIEDCAAFDGPGDDGWGNGDFGGCGDCTNLHTFGLESGFVTAPNGERVLDWCDVVWAGGLISTNCIGLPFSLTVNSNSANWRIRLSVTVTYTTGEFFIANPADSESQILYQGGGNWVLDAVPSEQLSEIEIGMRMFNCSGCPEVTTQSFEIAPGFSPSLTNSNICENTSSCQFDLATLVSNAGTSGYNLTEGEFYAEFQFPGETPIPGGPQLPTVDFNQLIEGSLLNICDIYNVIIQEAQDITNDVCADAASAEYNENVANTAFLTANAAAISNPGNVSLAVAAANAFNAWQSAIVAAAVANANCTAASEMANNIYGTANITICYHADCGGSDCSTLNIGLLADASFTLPETACSGSTISILPNQFIGVLSGSLVDVCTINNNELSISSDAPAGTYTLTNTITNGECSDTHSQEIILFEPINVTENTSFPNCSSSNQYTITLTISGGTGSYAVNGQTLLGNTFIDNLTSGANYNYLVDDTDVCNSVVVSGASICPNQCFAESGILTLMQGSTLCSSDGVEAQISGNNAGAGYVGLFILTNNSTEIIDQTSSDGNFPFIYNSGHYSVWYVNICLAGFPEGLPSFTPGIMNVAQISNVVANAPVGTIDLTGPIDLNVMNDITIDVLPICDGMSGYWTLQLRISGSLPEYNQSGFYNIIPIPTNPNDFFWDAQAEADGYVQGFIMYDNDFNPISSGQTIQITISDAGNLCNTEITTLLPDVECTCSLTSLVTNLVNPTCDNANGSITVAAFDGTGTLTYEWAHDINLISGTATGLSGGDYFVTISDVNNCQSMQNVTLTNISSSPTIQVVSVMPDNCGIGNGSAVVSASGGTLPYSYAWEQDLSLNSNTALALASGNYDVTVTDANNCSAVTTVNISTTNTITLILQSTTNASCNIDDGSAIVMVNGGTGVYTYSWSHNTELNSPLATSLDHGTYTVSATDNATGCLGTLEITISEEPSPVVGLTFISPTSCDNDLGSILVSVSGGTGTISYAWSHDALLNNPNPTGLPNGTYTVTVIDAIGCTDAETIVLGNTASWNCVGELSSTICSGTGTEGLFDPNPALNSPFYTTGGPNVLSAADCLASPTEIIPVYGGFELDDLSCAGPLIETQTEITTSPNFASPGTQSISVSFSGIPDEAIIEDIEISIAYEGTMPTSQGDINSLSVTAPGGISIMSWSDSACGPNVGPGGDPDAIGAGTGGDNFGLNNIEDCAAFDGPGDDGWGNGDFGGCGDCTNLHTFGLESGFVTAPNGERVLDWCDVVWAGGLISTNCIGLPFSLTVNSNSANWRIRLSVTVTYTTGEFFIANPADSESQILYQGGGNWVLDAVPSEQLSEIEIGMRMFNCSGCPEVTTQSFEIAPGFSPSLTNSNICENTSSCQFDLATLVSNAGTSGYNLTEGEFYAEFQFPGETPIPGGPQLPTVDFNQLIEGSLLNICDINNVIIEEAQDITNDVCADAASAEYNENVANTAFLTANAAAISNPGNVSLAVAAANAFNAWQSAIAAAAVATANCTAAVDMADNIYGTANITICYHADCGGSDCSTLNISMGITAIATPTQPTCGLNNGSISVTPLGGTYAWTGGLSGSNPTGVAPGTYTVTVTAAGGCTSSTSATINPPISFTAAASASQPSCGLNNGAIDITPAGAGYTYVWTPGTVSGSNPTGLGSGTYTVTVTQTATGCTSTATATLNEVAGLTATLNTTQPTCGLNNGSISVTPTSGTYTWTGGLTGSNPINVAPGTYSVTVTGAGGCTSSASATLNASTGITANATATQPTCGLNNGSISVTPAGGTYAWIGGLSGSNPTNVAPGTYIVTVTGAGGCTSSASTTVNASTGITATATPTQPTCGLNNGSISVTPAGGTYAWTGGLSGSNPTGVAPGTYTVTVTAVGGCTSSSSTTLNASTGITAAANPTQPSCGLNNGSISVTPVGGTYVWTGGLSGSSPTGVAPGTYTVTVTGAGGCTSSTSTTLNTSTGITAVATPTQPTCGLNNGSISVTPVGGSYTWTGGLSGSNPSGVAPGTYTVTVTGAGGCTSSASVTLNASTPSPTISLGTVQPICESSTSFSVSYSNTTGSPDQFSLTTAGAQPMPGFVPIVNAALTPSPLTIPVPAGVAAGTYQFDITVRNAATGCVSAPLVISLTINPQIQPTLTPIGPLCSLAAPVSLNPVQSGITGIWSGTGISGNQFNPSGLTGNVQLFFIPNVGQCAISNSMMVTVSAPAIFNMEQTLSPVICSDDDPIALNTTQYGIAGNWSGIGVLNNEFHPALAAFGTTTLNFTPLPTECALSGSIVVSVVYNLAESTLPSDFLLCAGDLQFLNELSGGLAGTWAGEGVFGNLFFSDLLQPGSYPITFTYSGATQCNTATVSAQVLAPIDTLNSSIICNGADYDISFSIQGGMPPYSANSIPLPGNGYSSYNQTGMTTLTIIDDAGCELPLQFSSLDCTNVAENPCNILATAQFIGIQDNSGHECEVGISISVLNGPTGLYEYSLDGINFQAENKFWLDTSILQQAYTPITAYVRHANCGTHAIDTLNVPAPPLSGCRLYIGTDLWAEVLDDYNQYRFVLEWMDGSYEPSIQTYEGEPVSVLVTDTLTFCTKLFTSKAPLLPRQTGVFYPNPNHGALFYYTLPETLYDQPIRAEVFNVAGQLVADVSPQPDADHTFTIDLRLHGEGMFIIRLQIGNWVEVHKVVVWV